MKNLPRLIVFVALVVVLIPAAPLLAAPARKAAPPAAAAIDVVELPSATSPLVSVHLAFDAGSIHDPAGKEGLAALTALMIGQAGTQKRSYGDLLEALYPMAAQIVTNTDREVTLLAGTVHRDRLDAYTALLEEALLHPAFAASDFTRNKEEQLAYLTNALRAGSDELLGLEAVQDEIYRSHPYGHPPAGTVDGLKSITLDDVKAFYREHYTRANLMLGVAGGYPQGSQGPQGYVARLQKDLVALPAGVKERRALPAPPKPTGRELTLIDKATASVEINFGFPLPITRADADYFPLMVANSYLGEHRTSYGVLMHQLREERGLNYGDYSYVEYWYNPPRTNYPTPEVPRRQQYFSVWIRPVVPADAQFALRAALYEVEKLYEKGMTKADFELTRDLLINYSKLWAQSLSNRLGFRMDSRFYGTPYYIDEIETRLKTMTVEQVNAAIKKYLDPAHWRAVVVTANAQQLKETLEKDEPSPKKYNSQVSAQVQEDDKAIVNLKVKPTRIDVVPVDQVFQK